VRGHALVDGFNVSTIRKTDVNVGVLEPKPRVHVGSNLVVRFYDVLEVHIDEVIE
jgi:hypothetical protein